MADYQRRGPYDERDFAAMANNIFHQLCEKEPGWHDIRVLAEEVKAYENSIDVAYIAEAVLVGELQDIERDPHSIKVKLTPLGTKNCGKRIDIPPSDIQKLIRIFESTEINGIVEAKKITN